MFQRECEDDTVVLIWLTDDGCRSLKLLDCGLHLEQTSPTTRTPRREGFPERQIGHCWVESVTVVHEGEKSGNYHLDIVGTNGR